jgi:hypothetical protein
MWSEWYFHITHDKSPTVIYIPKWYFKLVLQLIQIIKCKLKNSHVKTFITYCPTNKEVWRNIEHLITRRSFSILEVRVKSFKREIFTSAANYEHILCTWDRLYHTEEIHKESHPIFGHYTNVLIYTLPYSYIINFTKKLQISIFRSLLYNCFFLNRPSN